MLNGYSIKSDVYNSNFKYQPGWWYQFRAGDNSYCPMTEGQATTNNAKIVTWDACYVDTTHSWWKAIKGVNFCCCNIGCSTKFTKIIEPNWNIYINESEI